VGDTKRAARKAENSDTVDRLARLGLLSRGLIWLIIGVLAGQVALGGNDRVDKNGALHAIADKPLGEVLLVVLAVGFLGYAAWRLLEGAVGHRDQDEGRKRWTKRGSSLFRGGIYLFLAGSTAKYVVTGGSDDKTQPITARVMAHSGGRTLVLLVGAGIVIGGVAMAVRAFRQKFEDNLKTREMPGWLESATKVIGTAGLASRGLVFVLIGGFLAKAALQFDPEDAKGLDASLKTLAGQPYGPALLLVGAVGLLAFAFWSWIEARYRDI
jgi:di/tricarboxylate transporter